MSAAGTAAWKLAALAPLVPALASALELPRRVEGAGVRLTFDDGPHPEGTPAVLEALAAGGARATFFLVGEQVERYPALAARIAAGGHEVAVHGHRHRVLSRLGRGAIADDLDRAGAVIADATGALPRLHRPPLGIYSRAGVELVRARGWEPLLWSRWGRDWAGWATAGSVAALVTRGLAQGDVLLLHDSDAYSSPGSWRATAAALPRVLERVARSGLPTG